MQPNMQVQPSKIIPTFMKPKPIVNTKSNRSTKWQTSKKMLDKSKVKSKTFRPTASLSRIGHLLVRLNPQKNSQNLNRALRNDIVQIPHQPNIQQSQTILQLLQKQDHMPYRLSLSLLALFILITPTQEQITCHYTCATCFGTEYFQCLQCPQNRGTSVTFKPIAGMCYCTNETDEDISGVCAVSKEFNYNNKAIIAAFLGLALFFSALSALLTGQRHFLIKTIEDAQEISIIVFINLYFPQQFDIFLTNLYRFNISSFTFESLTSGSLFVIENTDLINSTDGQNIYGKYKLLYKTANFFANQFTWLIVFVCFIAVAIVLRVMRNRMKNCQKQQNTNQNKRVMVTSLETDPNYNNQMFESKAKNKEQSLQANNSQNETKSSCLYGIVNKVFNFVWLNFFIIFFYLSLIEININIFTQIGNLTFSSGFAATGAFFSALFLALQLVVLGLLALKIREETIKPEWMRDYTYTAAIYLVRTNYKTITKYFWFFACLKKLLLALMVTTLYQNPSDGIIGISSVQIIFICFAVYCEPFQRRYIRIHYYACQGMKLFLYVCLINFTEQYVSYARMIQLTKILYFMLAFFFGFNFFFIVCNIFAQRDMYIRSWVKRFYPDSDSEYKQGKLGYHSEGKLYIYQRE